MRHENSTITNRMFTSRSSARTPIVLKIDRFGLDIFPLDWIFSGDVVLQLFGCVISCGDDPVDDVAYGNDADHSFPVQDRKMADAVRCDDFHAFVDRMP